MVLKDIYLIIEILIQTANMYWLKISATFESDDERYENNGVIEAVNNISA